MSIDIGNILRLHKVINRPTFHQTKFISAHNPHNLRRKGLCLTIYTYWPIDTHDLHLMDLHSV